MPHVEISRQSPVVASAEALVDAPVADVWGILTAFEAWPTWNKSVSRMRVAGPLAVGTSFVWVAGGSRIVSRIEEIDPPTRLVWSGKTLGIDALHVWQLQAQGRATRIHTAESFDGLLARLFPGLLRKMLVKALEQGVAALKQAAETRRSGN